jgi:hypothetical protein
MIVRQFNEQGIESFRALLARCRMNPTQAVPRALLEKDSTTKRLPYQVTIKSRSFHNRREAADFLVGLLKDLPDQEISENAGLWTWLTLFFFDEVCPMRAGRRVVRNDYSYIFEPKNRLHYYRHLLFLPWRILKLAPKHNRLFLSGSLAVLDKMTEEVIKRLYLTRIPCMFEVLDRLYWDERRGKARAGISSPRELIRGDLIHRLPIRIRQLEKTYDLFSLNADQLIELLGDEFQHEREAAVART